MIKIEAVILAGGYATRLYPLTKDKPKPLLEVAGKPILEHIIDTVKELKHLKKIFVVTNNKFYQHFKTWLHNFDTDVPIEIINDGTNSNDDRLGAIGDIDFVIKNHKIDDDLMVIAGDNLFELSLADVQKFFNKKDSDVIVLTDVKDLDLAKHYGIVEVENEKVMHFEEKPQNPKSTLASTGIYFFHKKTVPLIDKYIDQGNDPDKSGSFVEWLHKREDVYAFVSQKPWYDIGTHDQLELANKEYKK